jgi:hypothetical protein
MRPSPYLDQEPAQFPLGQGPGIILRLGPCRKYGDAVLESAWVVKVEQVTYDVQTLLFSFVVRLWVGEELADFPPRAMALTCDDIFSLPVGVISPTVLSTVKSC